MQVKYAIKIYANFGPDIERVFRKKSQAKNAFLKIFRLYVMLIENSICQNEEKYANSKRNI